MAALIVQLPKKKAMFQAIEEKAKKFQDMSPLEREAVFNEVNEMEAGLENDHAMKMMLVHKSGERLYWMMSAINATGSCTVGSVTYTKWDQQFCSGGHFHPRN